MFFLAGGLILLLVMLMIPLLGRRVRWLDDRRNRGIVLGLLVVLAVLGGTFVQRTSNHRVEDAARRAADRIYTVLDTSPQGVFDNTADLPDGTSASQVGGKIITTTVVTRWLQTRCVIGTREDDDVRVEIRKGDCPR